MIRDEFVDVQIGSASRFEHGIIKSVTGNLCQVTTMLMHMIDLKHIRFNILIDDLANFLCI